MIPLCLCGHRREDHENFLADTSCKREGCECLEYEEDPNTVEDT